VASAPLVGWSFGISVSAMVGSPMMLCRRSISSDDRGGLLWHLRRNGPRGAVTTRLAARAAPRKNYGKRKHQLID
jgi:hypothetical protein